MERGRDEGGRGALTDAYLISFMSLFMKKTLWIVTCTRQDVPLHLGKNNREETTYSLCRSLLTSYAI